MLICTVFGNGKLANSNHFGLLETPVGFSLCNFSVFVCSLPHSLVWFPPSVFVVPSALLPSLARSPPAAGPSSSPPPVCLSVSLGSVSKPPTPHAFKVGGAASSPGAHCSRDTSAIRTLLRLPRPRCGITATPFRCACALERGRCHQRERRKRRDLISKINQPPIQWRSIFSNNIERHTQSGRGSETLSSYALIISLKTAALNALLCP